MRTVAYDADSAPGANLPEGIQTTPPVVPPAVAKSGWRPRRSAPIRAFTLVEMIGVLSIVAILASLIVPRVFQIIDEARYNSASASCNSVRAAINEYYGRYGKLGGPNGSDLGIATPGAISEDWDSQCLVPAGFLESPFVVRIGNRKHGQSEGGSRIRVINIRNNVEGTPVASDAASLELGAYNRNGIGATNDVLGGWVVEACIEEVDNREAMALNHRLDGDVLGVDVGLNDEAGRVKYFVGPSGLASVRVYLSHR